MSIRKVLAGPIRRMSAAAQVAAACCLVSLLAPGAAFAQQEKGDSEFAFNASLIVPHNDPADGTTGLVVPRFGKFLTAKDEVGFNTVLVVNGNSTTVQPGVFYRRFFGSSGSKVQPFAGLGAGVLTTSGDGASDTQAQANADLGVKFFLSRNTAFDVTYSFFTGFESELSVAERSLSVVSFGFSYIF